MITLGYMLRAMTLSVDIHRIKTVS